MIRRLTLPEFVPYSLTPFSLTHLLLTPHGQEALVPHQERQS
jgi:hypothetical protein